MKNLKIYFASKFECRLLVRCLSDYIQTQLPNISTTSRWLEIQNKHPIPECARMDYEDIKNAHITVGVAPFLGGANSELGYALGLGDKKVIYLIDPIIHCRIVAPIWSEKYPLPAGMLGYPYRRIAEKLKLLEGALRIDSSGYILHSTNDLISVLKFYQENL